MAGIVTTLFASLLAFVGGGLLSTLFTVYNESGQNQGLAAANGFLFVAIAYAVQLDILLLLGTFLLGGVVVGGVTEVYRD
jgi:hypothetical protein